MLQRSELLLCWERCYRFFYSSKCWNSWHQYSVYRFVNPQLANKMSQNSEHIFSFSRTLPRLEDAKYKGVGWGTKIYPVISAFNASQLLGRSENSDAVLLRMMVSFSLDPLAPFSIIFKEQRGVTLPRNANKENVTIQQNVQ